MSNGARGRRFSLTAWTPIRRSVRFPPLTARQPPACNLRLGGARTGLELPETLDHRTSTIAWRRTAVEEMFARRLGQAVPNARFGWKAVTGATGAWLSLVPEPQH